MANLGGSHQVQRIDELHLYCKFSIINNTRE